MFIYFSSATGLNEDYVASMFYYLDLTTNDSVPKWCDTIYRSIDCDNTTLNFLAKFAVDYSLTLFTPFGVSSTPSRTDIFIEECGMHIHNKD